MSSPVSLQGLERIWMSGRPRRRKSLFRLTRLAVTALVREVEAHTEGSQASEGAGCTNRSKSEAGGVERRWYGGLEASRR